MHKNMQLFFLIIFLTLMGVNTIWAQNSHNKEVKLPPMPEGGSACTTAIVTPGASADGSMLVAHSDDDHLQDQSIVFVAARDWPKGSKRAVYVSANAIGELPEFNAVFVPRIVGSDRSPAYMQLDKAKKSIPIGYIPQVAHTYAYIDANYGIINEHGLMFGECTNGSFISNGPKAGKRMFYTAELSRVALERCKTAREAVILMGKLVEEYGYYGTGETLPVADAKEAWVFEVAPSPTGTGGLWVAQRVPDGEFWVAANKFSIRDLMPNNPDQMWSKNLESILDKANWRSPKDKSKPIDWLSSVSVGEYSHPYYALRRVWRAYDLVAPSLKLSPWVENGLTRAYPFSIKPDKKISLMQLQEIYGDHYEGTEFDLTKGVAAGPFGSPERYLGPYDPSGDVGHPDAKLYGAWERPIGMSYTGYVFINQVKPDLPLALGVTLWVSLDRPADSTFVPLAVGPLPKSYEYNDTRKFSWDEAWWVYNLVGNYAQLKYSYMVKDIEARAHAHEEKARALQISLEKDLMEIAKTDPAQASKIRSEKFNDNAVATMADWRTLFEELVAKYAQGRVSTPDNMAQAVGYPQEWLDVTNYKNGPAKSYAQPQGK